VKLAAAILAPPLLTLVCFGVGYGVGRLERWLRAPHCACGKHRLPGGPRVVDRRAHALTWCEAAP
jgi:hypothetical protein